MEGVPRDQEATISVIFNHGVIYLSYNCNMELTLCGVVPAATFLVSGLIYSAALFKRVGPACPRAGCTCRPRKPLPAVQIEATAFDPVPSGPAGVLLHVRINGGRPLRFPFSTAAPSIL